MRLVPLTLGFLFAAGVAGAQIPERPDGSGQPRSQPDRQALEKQLRQGLANRARQELGLSPDQMGRLAEVNRKYAQQERQLDMLENQTRRALRDALAQAPSADQDKRIGDLHDQIVRIQRQRIDVSEAEQKELAGFLSNSQRVRFQGLQENFRRQLLDALRANGAGPGRRGRPPQ
jgi:hypothetical protein